MPSRRDPDALLRRHARTMRREPTDAEKALWPHLRNRNCANFKFRRQVPLEGYIADFYCDAASLAIELDGDDHGTPEAAEYDAFRTEQLAKVRIRVTRFQNRDVLRDPRSIARTIERILTTGS